MKKLLIILNLIFSSVIHAAVVIQGNDTIAPFGFTVPVSVSAYDPFFGDFFVGLTAGGGTSALASASRPNFMSAPTFTPIATNVLVTSKAIEMLTIAQQTTQLSVLGVITQAFIPFTQTQIVALRTDGSQALQTASLNDASGTTTEGIIALAANPNFFFAAVRPSGGDFGEADGGIALVGITVTPDTLVLTVKDATTGLPDNMATPLQNDSDQLDGGTNPVIFQTINATNIVALTWDQRLQRLYIGTLISTGTTVGDIGKSIVVGRLDTTANNALILDPIVNNGAITPGGNQIIVAQNNGIQYSLSARHIGVLHASTGPDYLIVNGGRDVIDLVGNSIRALPLVNDPTNPTINGTLANKNSPLNSNFVFTQPATMIGELPNDTDPAAIVGDGPLPIQPADQISQMQVIGDTVYVALNFTPSAMHDTGIFFSQALFGADGKIIRWTPWTRRASPINLFLGTTLPGNVTSDGAVQSFAVDTQTGNIIFVEGTTGQVVGITNWNTGLVPTDLTTQLNKILTRASTAVLDLDQATRGFQGNTSQRYALFGGLNKVVFARISQAFDNNLLTGPQQVITDFSNPQNFFVSSLPAGAGSVQVLEYSRTTTNEPNNFFFAGTQNGLFAFAGGGGSGFAVNQLGFLDTNPFDSSAWQKIQSITGSIIDIKTSGAGQALYVLALQSTPEMPLGTTLYSIPFASTLGAMFAPANIKIIAQTGQGIFQNIQAFYGIQIVATGDPLSANPEDKEQLILATNNGLFASHADQIIGNGISTALNQTDALWQLVSESDSIAFFGIAGIDTPIRSTVWPFAVVDDQRGCHLFSRSSIFQLSAQGDLLGNNALIGNFIPAHFNANPLIDAFKTLDPIIYFYSDGARRFFIMRRYTQNPIFNSLAVIPYDIALDNQTMTTFLSVAAVTDQRFYWIREIGASGLVFAGTGHGVVSLS